MSRANQPGVLVSGRTILNNGSKLEILDAAGRRLAPYPDNFPIFSDQRHLCHPDKQSVFHDPGYRL